MNSPYVRNGDSRVWRRVGFEGLVYSDGQETERRVLQVLRGARRIDTFSPELRQAITDWPSEYHLSRARHCLLRPLCIRAGDRVLEIGCGCGALTRYLGETGACVTALEGNSLRASIAAERCRDLANVRVYCEDLTQFEAQESFDWIVMVGVLEYAPLFSRDPHPVEHYVRSVVPFLSPKGALIIAIENQLGLKYFNGCAEDHIGVPFFGIEGLYQSSTPVTFGRKDLGQRLSSCGLPALEWFYPYPDYKLPSVIVSEHALSASGPSVADLLARVQSRDYRGHPLRLFEESLTLAVLERNDLIADMANSFLLVARSASLPPPASQAIAWSFAVERHERFATETAFVRDGGALTVRKSSLSLRPGCKTSTSIGQRLDPAPYRRGKLLVWRVIEANARNATIEQMTQAFDAWFAEVLSRAWRLPDCEAVPGLARLSHYWLDGDLIDCTPFNIVEQHGRHTLIDQEWVWHDRIPLGLVVCRGVVHSLALPLARAAAYDLVEIVNRLCVAHNLVVDAEEIAGWLGLEAQFLRTVGVPLSLSPSPGSCRSHLSLAFPELVRRVQEVESLREELIELRANCARHRIHAEQQAAVSWKLREALRRRTREIVALRQFRDSQAVATDAVTRDLSEQQAAADRPAAEISHSSDIIALAQERDVVRALLDIARAERDVAQAALARAEQTSREVVASRSWRLTAPLRALKSRAGLIAARIRA
jgi:SAM-dependent methyltransferase